MEGEFFVLNIKLEFLKKYIENNTKEITDFLNKVIKTKIEKIELIKEIKEEIFDGINILTKDKDVTIAICKKGEANNVAYKYWAYFCQNNKEINVLDKIDLYAYSKELHHDIMEIQDKEKNIKILAHFIFNNELVENHIIAKDELLIVIENN